MSRYHVQLRSTDANALVPSDQLSIRAWSIAINGIARDLGACPYKMHLISWERISLNYATEFRFTFEIATIAALEGLEVNHERS